MLEGCAPCLCVPCSSFRARYLKRTTWPPCGSCRVFSSVRTTGTEWERQWKEPQPVPTTTNEETLFQGSGRVQAQLFFFLFFFWGGGWGGSEGMCMHTPAQYIHMSVFLIFKKIFVNKGKLKLNSYSACASSETGSLGFGIFASTCSFCYQVDGMDVLCVREAAKFAAEYCRAGKVSLWSPFLFHRWNS